MGKIMATKLKLRNRVNRSKTRLRATFLIRSRNRVEWNRVALSAVSIYRRGDDRRANARDESE
jgi:hypothetical protein